MSLVTGHLEISTSGLCLYRVSNFYGLRYCSWRRTLCTGYRFHIAITVPVL